MRFYIGRIFGVVVDFYRKYMAIVFSDFIIRVWDLEIL